MQMHMPRELWWRCQPLVEGQLVELSIAGHLSLHTVEVIMAT